MGFISNNWNKSHLYNAMLRATRFDAQEVVQLQIRVIFLSAIAFVVVILCADFPFSVSLIFSISFFRSYHLIVSILWCSIESSDQFKWAHTLPMHFASDLIEFQAFACNICSMYRVQDNNRIKSVNSEHTKLSNGLHSIPYIHTTT